MGFKKPATCPWMNLLRHGKLHLKCKMVTETGNMRSLRTTLIANGLVQLRMLMKKLWRKNYCLLKSCLQQLYFDKIMKQLLNHILFSCLLHLSVLLQTNFHAKATNSIAKAMNSIANGRNSFACCGLCTRYIQTHLHLLRPWSKLDSRFP